MEGDFYSTIAQVLPLLLLALIWDSDFLRRLRGQPRRLRRLGVDGEVLFWTKARVRVYTICVALVVLSSTEVVLCVLAGFIPDSFTLRIVLMCCVGLVLATMLVRIWVDVIAATVETGPISPPMGTKPDTLPHDRGDDV